MACPSAPGAPIDPDAARDRCEAHHTHTAGSALFRMVPAANFKGESMTTRRLAYWWFRLVVSGRFLANFLRLPRIRR
jgi:hypothetical protein